MTAQLASRQTSGDQNMTPEDFQAIATLAKSRFGLALSESKIPLIQSRLSKRLKVLGLADFKSYCGLLNDPNNVDEHNQLLSALTTNVTHFFRENHHFDTLRTEVLPNLIEAAKAGKRVRLWSSACSTGQEPYSMAIELYEACNTAASLDIKILATDIDPKVVQRAQDGVFSAEEVETLSEQRRATHFDPLTGAGGGLRIKDNIRSLVSFGVLNLIEPLPFSGAFDAIFCRNVAIYFDRPTQQDVWTTLTDVLSDQGRLFIGHSERVSGPASERLKASGITTYTKIGA